MAAARGQWHRSARGVFLVAERALLLFETGRVWYRRLRKRFPNAKLVHVATWERLAEADARWPRAPQVLALQEGQLVRGLAHVCRRRQVGLGGIAVVLPSELGWAVPLCFRAGATWVQTSLRPAAAFTRVIEKSWAWEGARRVPLWQVALASWGVDWQERARGEQTGS